MLLGKNKVQEADSDIVVYKICVKSNRNILGIIPPFYKDVRINGGIMRPFDGHKVIELGRDFFGNPCYYAGKGFLHCYTNKECAIEISSSYGFNRHEIRIVTCRIPKGCQYILGDQSIGKEAVAASLIIDKIEKIK